MRHNFLNYRFDRLIKVTLCTFIFYLPSALSASPKLVDTNRFTQKLNMILQEKTEQKRYHMSVELITNPRKMKQIEKKRDKTDGPACLFIGREKLWDTLSLQFAYQGIRPAELNIKAHLRNEWKDILDFDQIAVCEWTTNLEESNTEINYGYVLTVGQAPGNGMANDKIMWVFQTKWLKNRH